MIKPLWMKEMKTNFKFLLLFLMLITMYVSVIIMLYDPELGSTLDMMAQSMPEVFAAFGMMNSGATLIDFVVNYLYGFILILIPFIYALVLCHRVMIRYMDRGSMAYLLSSAHSRSSIVLTQYIVLIVNLLLLTIYTTISIAFFAWMMNYEVDGYSLVVLNVGLFALQLFLGTMCFLFACICSEAKYALGIGAGLSLVFLLVSMLSQISDDAAWLKYFTPLTLFDAKGLVANEESAMMGMLILFGISFVMYVLANGIFKRKDLSF